MFRYLPVHITDGSRSSSRSSAVELDHHRGLGESGIRVWETYSNDERDGAAVHWLQ